MHDQHGAVDAVEEMAVVAATPDKVATLRPCDLRPTKALCGFEPGSSKTCTVACYGNCQEKLESKLSSRHIVAGTVGAILYVM